ncbi:MAG: hypothetical protein MJZ98_06995 [Paludibacteraceae bacterium]|nr:hypothetical protein [Paludibacteraceae bacterium]
MNSIIISTTTKHETQLLGLLSSSAGFIFSRKTSDESTTPTIIATCCNICSNSSEKRVRPTAGPEKANNTTWKTMTHSSTIAVTMSTDAIKGISLFIPFIV